MRAILALAQKDLQVLLRVRIGVFFTFVWPILVAVLFGVIFSGPGESNGRIAVALVDEDASPQSKEFVTRMEKGGKFDILKTDRNEAASLVRQGRRTAGIVLVRGFGEASDRIFYGNPPKVEVLIDPSRKAESGMIEGLLFQQAAEGMQKVLSDRTASQNMIHKALNELDTAKNFSAGERESLSRYLGELDRFLGNQSAQQAGTGSQAAWKPIDIENKAITIQRSGPLNPFEVTFPQGVLWGIIGCVMTFGIGIVSERTHGTLLRLQVAPIGRAQLLAGKALACFISISIVQVGLFVLGRLFFRVRPSSVGLLVLAGLSVSVAFVGIMMLVSSLGKTEQAAAGAGWAVMLPMSMLGGGMVPLFVMPAWMTSASQISPIKWAILALEGALWRSFTLQEMILPCSILVAVGVACFFIGTRTFRAAS